MRFNILPLLCVPLFTVPANSAVAQDVGRVSPAATPLPLPTAKPVPPDVLRAQNPWNMPMTGIWKFALTHGSIKAGGFVPANAGTNADKFASASFDDAGWDKLPVPSNWEMYGY